MTFQGSSHPPAPRSGAFPSAVSHHPNYHSGFLSHLSDAQQALQVRLQSSRPGIISVLGTQHYRQHWRRVSTLRAGKTNCVCSDLMFTSAQRGCLVFLGFFLRVLCAKRLPAVSCGCRCALEAGRSARVRVCSRSHTSAPPNPPSSLFLSMQKPKT